MTAPTSTLAVRPLVPADEPDVLRLLFASLAGGPTGERTADFFRWKHLDNPFGPSIALGAEVGGELVGVRLVMRWGLLSAGSRVTAGRMVDTATHPDHRGRGIFRDLTTASLDLARADTDVIFNTPNGSSRPGYLKMGWTQVGVVSTSISPVRPLRLARGAQAALRRVDRPAPAAVDCPLPRLGDVLAAHEEEVDDLLAARRAAAGDRLVTDTDLDWLRWRYVAVPGLDYRAVPVLDGGRLRGLGIGRLRDRAGLRELTLSDVIVAPGDGAARRRVLRAARRSRVDHVATHLPERDDAARRDLLAAGYVTSSRVGLTLTTLPLRWLPVDPVDARCWSLPLGDLEVF